MKILQILLLIILTFPLKAQRDTAILYNNSDAAAIGIKHFVIKGWSFKQKVKSCKILLKYFPFLIKQKP